MHGISSSFSCAEAPRQPTEFADRRYFLDHLGFVIFNGLFILLFLAAGGIPKGSNQGDPPLGIIGVAALLTVASVAIRFLLIPKIKDPVKLLPAMVFGLALAEVIGIIGMFVVGREFPETRIALFVTSDSAVTGFAPVYVHSLSERQKMR